MRKPKQNINRLKQSPAVYHPLVLNMIRLAGSSEISDFTPCAHAQINTIPMTSCYDVIAYTYQIG